MILLGFTGFYCFFLLGCTGLYSVLLGFTCFYWVLLGFTVFFWAFTLLFRVLLGVLDSLSSFTESYWVFI